MSKDVWCVHHNEGWCACLVNRKPKEGAWNVETKCDHFVVLPMGFTKRIPDCPECLEILKLKGAIRWDAIDEIITKRELKEPSE